MALNPLANASPG